MYKKISILLITIIIFSCSFQQTENKIDNHIIKDSLKIINDNNVRDSITKTMFDDSLNPIRFRDSL